MPEAREAAWVPGHLLGFLRTIGEGALFPCACRARGNRSALRTPVLYYETLNRRLPFLLSFALHACTTQLSDDNKRADATPEVVDAMSQPDALPPGLRDGELCAVTPEDASGGCAPGYACTVFGGGQSYCRQTCPTLDLACSGYQGPGYSLCALTYTNSGGQQGSVCLIVCGDRNMTLRGCDDGACNGTCPGSWTCQTDPINFGLESCQ
jgi:hypothetical protein